MVNKFGLGRYRVLDLGCGFGDLLAQCGTGSIGLEFNEERISRCRNRALRVIKWNFIDSFPGELAGESFDVVLLSHFLEHVFSPHSILIGIRKFLRDNGRIFIHVPVVQRLGFLTEWRRDKQYGFHGFLYGDHVNFFTPVTLRLTCEYAGFRTEYLGNPHLGIFSRVMLGIWPTVWYVGKIIRNFQYDGASCKSLDDHGNIIWKV